MSKHILNLKALLFSILTGLHFATFVDFWGGIFLFELKNSSFIQYKNTYT